MSRRSGLALLMVGLIVLITASWWGLALWPMPTAAPGWLARARDVCFGTAPDGMPSPGGWVLLIGEPIGMLLVVLVIWGDAVREGFAALGHRWWGRALLVGAAVCLLTGARWVAERVADARGERFNVRGGSAESRMDAAAPALNLTDQDGEAIRLASYRGRPALVAFAYGHCATLCPVIVRDLVEAARRLGDGAPELLIVTLDPWRDTPMRLPAIAKEWELPRRAHVLSGSIAEVEQALDAWQVVRARDASTGEISHQRVAYLVAPSGRLVARLDGTPDGVVAAVQAGGASGTAR